MNMLILAAAAAISTAPVSGSATLQSAAPAPAANDVLVCRQEVVMGSRLPVKVCASRASRATAEGRSRQDRQALERMQGGGFTGRAHIN